MVGPRVGDLRRGLAEGAGGIATEVAQRRHGEPALAKRALATLERYLAGHASPDVPAAAIARALALAEPTGLPAAEVYDITGRRGPVMPILRAHAAFVRDRDGHWHPGTLAQPIAE